MSAFRSKLHHERDPSSKRHSKRSKRHSKRHGKLQKQLRGHIKDTVGILTKLSKDRHGDSEGESYFSQLVGFGRSIQRFCDIFIELLFCTAWTAALLVDNAKAVFNISFWPVFALVLCTKLFLNRELMQFPSFLEYILSVFTSIPFLGSLFSVVTTLLTKYTQSIALGFVYQGISNVLMGTGILPPVLAPLILSVRDFAIYVPPSLYDLWGMWKKASKVYEGEALEVARGVVFFMTFGLKVICPFDIMFCSHAKSVLSNSKLAMSILKLFKRFYTLATKLHEENFKDPFRTSWLILCPKDKDFVRIFVKG